MALSANYNPKDWEEKILSKWEKTKVANPEKQVQTQYGSDFANYPTFCIIMPPPNLTGELHAGHAFGHYLMDTLCRIHRQRGEETLWFPGVDHAGIQMEGVINKYLQSKGIDPSSLSREEFVKICWEKAREWRNRQKEQSCILGSAPDYSRELFTLDERAVKMVEFAFKKYWEDGLVYKGSYLVNWSVGLQTALSDVAGEIEYQEMVDPLVTFGYRFQNVVNSSDLSQKIIDRLVNYFLDNPVLVSTVRPETIPGDVAVVIHPNRLRSQLHHYGFEHEQVDNILHVIQSNSLQLFFGISEFGANGLKLLISDKVDNNFGTGAVKITPGHDQFDYNIYQEFVEAGLLSSGFKNIISRVGKITDLAPIGLAGKTVAEARLLSTHLLIELGYVPKAAMPKNDDIVEFFKDIEDIEQYNVDWNYTHSVAICERSKTVIEPLISEEFFLSLNKSSISQGQSLSELGIEGCRQVRFYPSEYSERGIKFLQNINDWCISRDLSWGHQMPVWYNVELNPDRVFYNSTQTNVEISVSGKTKTMSVNQLMKVQSNKPIDSGKWVREEKILDTWFSSSLWPLTTLNYYKAQQKIQAVVLDLNGVLFDNQSKVIEANLKFVQYIYTAGIKIYYLTNSTRESLLNFKNSSIYQYFAGGLASCETIYQKPNPKFFTDFTVKYDLDPDKVFYVDDSVDNIMAADKCGWKCVKYSAEVDIIYEFGKFLDSQNTDFEKFYPTQVMATAKEIFYLWVVRMIMLGKYFTGDIPFEKVVITPTVLDGQGKKMSKSLGNGLKPEEAIEKFSSDALRLGMLGGMIPDRNMKFGGNIADTILEQKRNFANKVWNIARFFEYQKEQGVSLKMVEQISLSAPSQWIIYRFSELVKKLEDNLEDFELIHSVDALENFLWDDLADWYIEYLKSDSSQVAVGLKVFEAFIMVASPYMPFEMEVLWQEFLQKKQSLALAKLDLSFWYQINLQQRGEFEQLISLVNNIRSIKGVFNIDQARSLNIYSSDRVAQKYSKFISNLTKVNFIETLDASWYHVKTDEYSYSLDLANIFTNKDVEIKRSRKVIIELDRQILALTKQLENTQFLDNASIEVINQKRNDLEARKLDKIAQEVKIAYIQALT